MMARAQPFWTIVPAKKAHILPIAAHMRAADRREVWASHRHTPEEALGVSLALADRAWTCLFEGEPALMWGVCRRSMFSPIGVPWLLGTDAILSLRREFLRQSRRYVALMAEGYERLENHVHADNALSIKWLCWCGFTVGAEAIRLNGEQFYPFWREC